MVSQCQLYFYTNAILSTLLYVRSYTLRPYQSTYIILTSATIFQAMKQLCVSESF